MADDESPTVHVVAEEEREKEEELDPVSKRIAELVQQSVLFALPDLVIGVVSSNWRFSRRSWDY